MDTETHEHLLRICRDAGLQSAIGVFEVLYDREVLTDQIALSLGPEDVSEIYTEAMGPAIDKAETLLLRHLVGPIPSVTACAIKVEWHRTTADPDQVTCMECKVPNYGVHRNKMAELMLKVADDLSEMFSYWVVHDLPPDFLSENEFPFHLSLEDFTAEVRHAAEAITSKEEA